MLRIDGPRITIFALALASGAMTGAVFAAERALETSVSALLPSAAPPLLEPIDEAGRTGWTCLPEIRARATSAARAVLPDPDR